LHRLTINPQQLAQFCQGFLEDLKIEDLNIDGAVLSAEQLANTHKNGHLKGEDLNGTKENRDVTNTVQVLCGCKKVVISDSNLFIKLHALDFGAADPSCEVWIDGKQIPLVALVGKIKSERPYRIIMPGKNGITWHNGDTVDMVYIIEKKCLLRWIAIMRPTQRTRLVLMRNVSMLVALFIS
jgi:hypothetical protein